MDRQESYEYYDMGIAKLKYFFKYYDNGRLMEEPAFTEYFRDGEWKQLFDNGRLQYLTTYSLGKKYGLYEEWLIDKSLVQRGYYENDLLSALWTYVRNDSIIKYEVYDADSIIDGFIYEYYENDKKISAVLYDGVKLPFENNFFDRIIIFHALEHVNDPENFLFEMMSKLKKGGVLSISLPTDPGLIWRLGRLFIKYFIVLSRFNLFKFSPVPIILTVFAAAILPNNRVISSGILHLKHIDVIANNVSPAPIRSTILFANAGQ